MSEEKFWIVRYKEANGRWKSFPGTLSSTRKDSIQDFERGRQEDWDAARKEEDLRCIKVRVVPVEEGK